MVSQCNMQIIGTHLETKQISNIHRSQYSLSEALELLGCSDLSPDPPGLLLPLNQAEKESRNNLLSQRSQNLGATGWIMTLICSYRKKRPVRKTRWDAGTYDITVLVDTMYSTSLVQGFIKLNHWLCKVTKEPCFVLNL